VSRIIAGRRQARIDKPLALFLIGMRINKLWGITGWGPVAMAMPRMLAELKNKPEAGLLWHRQYWSGRNVMMLQYWESMEKLFAYAHDRQGEHFPAWAAFGPAHHPMIARALCDHVALRRLAYQVAGEALSVAVLDELGVELERHIRFEERSLFPLIEEALSDDALAKVGRALANVERSSG